MGSRDSNAIQPQPVTYLMSPVTTLQYRSICPGCQCGSVWINVGFISGYIVLGARKEGAYEEYLSVP